MSKYNFGRMFYQTGTVSSLKHFLHSVFYKDSNNSSSLFAPIL